MFSIFALVVAPNDGLHVFEKLGADKRFVLASIRLAAPFENSDVNGIRENRVQVGTVHRFSEFIPDTFP
ncbi:MAG TPA: hypothetical protein VD837_09265 [Terriglobales bacterium]|nr:hypothetical protein [Terriglobales bacterium]